MYFVVDFENRRNRVVPAVVASVVPSKIFVVELHLPTVQIEHREIETLIEFERTASTTSSDGFEGE